MQSGRFVTGGARFDLVQRWICQDEIIECAEAVEIEEFRLSGGGAGFRCSRGPLPGFEPGLVGAASVVGFDQVPTPWGRFSSSRLTLRRRPSGLKR